MKAKIIISTLLIILVFQHCNLLACKCKSLDYSKQYKSDLIFIGKVLSIDAHSKNFRVEVFEMFKGSSNDTMTAIFDNCSIYPVINDTWLFFSNKISSDTIYISQCGFSKNFNNPVNLNLLNEPRPFLGETLNSSDSLLLNTVIRNSLYMELYHQIEDLKLQKISTDLEVVKVDLKKIQMSIRVLIFLSILLIFIFILVMIISHMIFTRNKSLTKK